MLEDSATREADLVFWVGPWKLPFLPNVPLTSISRQLTNYATKSEYDDYAGFFIMRHKVNSMSASGPTNTSNLEDVWFDGVFGII